MLRIDVFYFCSADVTTPASPVCPIVTLRKIKLLDFICILKKKKNDPKFIFTFLLLGVDFYRKPKFSYLFYLYFKKFFRFKIKLMEFVCFVPQILPPRMFY